MGDDERDEQVRGKEMEVEEAGVEVEDLEGGEEASEEDLLFPNGKDEKEE